MSNIQTVKENIANTPNYYSENQSSIIINQLKSVNVIKNPIYLALILYIFTLIIVLYTFDHSCIPFIKHVKFLIYTYILYVIYNHLLISKLLDSFKQEYNVVPNVEVAKNVVSSNELNNI
jgi:Na+/alanine symporter